MIHQFQTKNAAPVIMLDDLTHRIFNAIGRPFQNQGIFLPEQIPGYIERLQAAIDAEHDKAPSSGTGDDEDQSTDPDPLGRRAYPFLELLRQALKNQEPVIWGV